MTLKSDDFDKNHNVSNNKPVTTGQRSQLALADRPWKHTLLEWT